MLDCVDYTTGDNGHQGNGNNGYDRLTGDYALFYQVAKGFTRKVKPQDRQDTLHDLLLAMATVKATYDTKGKELTKGGMIRVAQYGIAEYWRKLYNRNQSHDCGQCANRQRQKCRKNNSYGVNCPKAIQIDSYDRLIHDGNGDSTPLCEMIADDKADFTPRLEAKHIINGYPRRFVQLAYKKYAGYRLTDSEAHYYRRERKKAQEKL